VKYRWERGKDGKKIRFREGEKIDKKRMTERRCALYSSGQKEIED